MINHHVIEWQRALGLLETGYFDKDTLAASFEVLAASRTIPAPPSDPEQSAPDTWRPAGHHEQSEPEP